MKAGPRWWGLERLLGRDVAADAREEIAHHLELRTAELIRRGMAPAEARAEALRRFGDPGKVRREVEAIDRRAARSRGRAAWLADVGQDAGFAVRGLVRNRAFGAAAIVTLGLGIGANAAVFSAVSQVLLRPLPVAEPERLMMVWEENPQRGWVRQTAAPANYLDWREGVPAFAGLGAYADFEDRVTIAAGAGEPQVVESRLASGDLFRVLGIEPHLGTLPSFDDTWATASPKVVLGHGAWTRVFGGDRSVVGRAVRIDGESYEVAAVLPEDFALPGVGAEVWLPFRWSPEDVPAAGFRRAHWLRVIGRLAPGASAAAAGRQLEAVMARLEAEYPETNRAMSAGATPLHDFLVGDRRISLLVLLGAVGVLLVLACANVGNLLLVRGLGRRRELAVRAALGASRVRLVRQGLVESVVLAGLGSLVGLGIAWALLRGIQAVGRGSDLVPGGLAIDGTFVAFLGAVTLACASAFAVVPGLLSGWTRPGEALRATTRGSTVGRGGRRAAAWLVTVEVALAFLLLSGAALLVRSYLGLRRVDVGFESAGVLTASISLPVARYPAEALPGFYGRVLERAGALPGVAEVGLVRQLPLGGPSWSSDVSVEGRAAEAAGLEVLHREVAGDYFATLRIPVVRGRTFTRADEGAAEAVVVINDVLAAELFGGEDPIDQRVAFTRTPTEETTWWRVIGVVGGERQVSPAEPPRPEIFAQLAQDPTAGIVLVARTEGDPTALARPLANAVRELDPELALYDVRTLREVRSAAVAREEFLALLVGVFGAIALVLAVVGVYGVVAQSLRQQRREIGIRLAVGAEEAHILRLASRQTGGMLGAGIGMGLVAAALTGRLLEAVLYGVSPLDPASLVTAPAMLAVTGLAAAALPAWRASRADAAAILREEG